MIADALNKRAANVDSRKLVDSSDNDAQRNSMREKLERQIKELEGTLSKDVRDLKARNEILEIELARAHDRDHALSYEVAEARDNEN